jgi:biofilm PGA synthesis N-glycosyltransferase PgaC
VTADSIVTQTRRPLRWVVVDDGSSDRTAAIVREYELDHPWIELISLPARTGRDFSQKVRAVNTGLERVAGLEFEVVVNMDADVSFAPGYMEFLIQKFVADPALGVSGTPFTEAGGYDSTRDSFEGDQYVAGPCQLFRRRCFREIGGYVANPAGGVDWIAVMTARMRGWKVQAFADKRFHHHRPMGTAGKGRVAAQFSYGQKDYYLGGSPVWQLFRAAYRMAKPPLVTGGLALLLGYGWAAVRRVERPVTPELMHFHRQDQLRKLRRITRTLARFQRPERFRSVPGAATHYEGQVGS